MPYERVEGVLKDLESTWAVFSKEQSVFSGWSWCDAWWRTWGELCNLNLHLYTLKDNDGREIAIAPFFSVSQKNRLGFYLDRLHVFGNLYPSDTTVLSEYIDLPIDTTRRDAVAVELSVLLGHIHWDEFVVPFTTKKSFIYKFLHDYEDQFRFLDVVHEGSGIKIDTSGSFDNYLKGLGKNTRLKLYNRRKVLEFLGEVDIEYACPDNTGEFLDDLNRLSKDRWGSCCFGPQSTAFHLDVALQACIIGNLLFSRLKVDNEIVSVLYNIRSNGVVYNIQSAYVEDYHPRLSLGTLHLGYSIEAAFSDVEIQSFDLLFGEGKNSFYKEHLGGCREEFFTLTCGKTFKSKILSRMQRFARYVKQSVFKLLR